jgi:predicted amidohydrolase YtcJ
VLALGLQTGDHIEGGQGLVTMGPLKVISDGSLNTRTAYCCEPYVDDPSSYGAMNLSPAELTDLLKQAKVGGLEAAVHAIGDAAAGVALDAFSAAGIRGSIEHAQLLAPQDVIRMGRLNVVASVQPAHLFDDRDATMTCWPDRAHRCFPFRSMVSAGVQLAFG